MVGGGRPLLPEILGQPAPFGAKSHSMQRGKNQKIYIIESQH